VELLTPSQRISLLAPPQIPQLNPGGCEERIVGHEVKELGEHRYKCVRESVQGRDHGRKGRRNREGGNGRWWKVFIL